ncbi:MAG: hypothetical protein LBC79_02615 [Deltaproteobacteria bacterium]|jgi:hypothetical protein|nr:hypothetical protein [Deltaproteobacteria bacterium]
MKRFVSAVCGVLLVGCIGSGPGKALHEVASSLERKDSAAFLARMDAGRYAAAFLDNLTQGNPALRALDSAAGKLLGMGVADMVNSLTQMEEQIAGDFKNRVATGELVNECSQAASSGCPWVPASLRSAKIKELGPEAAVAHVTVPGNIATWIAMAKTGGEWKIVGLSPREEFATRYAQNPPAPPAPPAQRPAAPAGPEKPTSI